MSVTRQALRVYAALTELRDRRGDVLDALIPFFEPILSVMNKRFFDPRLFAVGVKAMYRWPFTRDIAEQFIPRLVAKGYLERVGAGRDAAYVVKFTAPTSIGDNQTPIKEALEEIISEFENFPPRVTDLLTYNKSREELTDILVRFLVSLDAYGETELVQEVDRAALGDDAQTLVDQLDQGGSPLPHDDRYICARFVHYLCHEKPQYVSQLARLASVGLLTEVVADFVKPTQPVQEVDLTIVIDAPLALDYLGCSGKALQNDARVIFSALQSIGCKFVVFDISCAEMKRNLDAMLSRPPSKRDGYTHEAMVRNEVIEDFVIAVARDPEAALDRAGIKVRQLSLHQFPNTHQHFDDAHYEDFFASVNWVQDIHPREHDATCLTLVMRLRTGRHSSDLFRCGYVFVTRNSAFVRQSRAYCIQNGMLSAFQQGPIAHQRELRVEFQTQLKAERAKNTAQRKAVAATAARAMQERDAALALVARDEQRRSQLVDNAIQETNRICKWMARVASGLLILIGLLALYDLVTENLSSGTKWPRVYLVWHFIVVVAAILAGYYLILDVREQPKRGISSLLNSIARTLLRHKFKQKGLEEDVLLDQFVIRDGQIRPVK